MYQNAIATITQDAIEIYPAADGTYPMRNTDLRTISHVYQRLDDALADLLVGISESGDSFWVHVVTPTNQVLAIELNIARVLDIS